MRRASTGTKQKWTVEEEVALREGVKRYGPGKWRQIQKDPELQAMLRNRTNVDLKDKWRNISMDNAPRRGGASTAANSGNKRRRRTPAERPRRMSDDSEEDVEVGVEEDSPRVRRQQPRRGVRQQSFLPEEAESDEASRKEEEEQDLLPTGYSNGSSRSCTPTSLESDGQSGRSEWGSAAYNTEDNVLPFEAYKITEAAMMILYGHGQGSGLQEITDWIKAALHFADGDSIDMSYIGEILEDMVKQGRATCSNGMYHPTGPLRELVDSAVKMAAFIDTAPDAPQTPPKPSPSSSDGQGSVVRDTSDGSSSATNGSEQNLAINQRDPSQINVDVLMETIDMIREAENDAYSRARATWIRENFGTFVREQYDQGHLPAENRWAAYLGGPLDKGLLPAGEG